MKLKRDIPVQVFAHVGNIGNASVDPNLIAGMVVDFQAGLLADRNQDVRQRGNKVFQAVFSTGGNTSHENGVWLDYDVSIGRNFYSFLWPYLGNQGVVEELERNQFFVAMDDADWQNDFSYEFGRYFGPETRGYYDAVYGNVHFFVLDASQFEPDGKTANSAQAQWLKLHLLLSTATWKIVVMAYPPYSSAITVDADLQWNFEQWGADMVLSGGPQCYERQLRKGTTFIQNGLGLFETPAAIADLDPRSQYFYNASAGHGRITSDENTLTYEFLDIGGNVVDSVTLNAAEKIPFVIQSAPVIAGVQGFAGDGPAGSQTPYLGAGFYYNYAAKEFVPWHGFLNCWLGYPGTGGGDMVLSAGVQAFAGDGPPTLLASIPTPANGAGTYYDYTSKVLYNWNPSLNADAGGWDDAPASANPYASVNPDTGQQYFCGYGNPPTALVPAAGAGIYFDFQANQVLNWNPLTNLFE